MLTINKSGNASFKNGRMLTNKSWLKSLKIHITSKGDCNRPGRLEITTLRSNTFSKVREVSKAPTSAANQIFKNTNSQKTICTW